MSKKQWGHGYWAGMRDANEQIGRHFYNQEEFELYVEWIILAMFMGEKGGRKSYFEVKRYYGFFEACGFSKQQLEIIHKYVKYFSPFGCEADDEYFITGFPAEEVYSRNRMKEIIDRLNEIKEQKRLAWIDKNIATAG